VLYISNIGEDVVAVVAGLLVKNTRKNALR
jgi:hypothetical protein